MATKLKKVNKIGDRAYHVFLNGNGEEVLEQITIDEYHAIGNNPVVRPDLAWKYSLITPHYDTPTGLLEANEFAELESGEVAIKLQNMKAFEYPCHLSSSVDKDGILSASVEAKIKNKFKL